MGENVSQAASSRSSAAAPVAAPAAAVGGSVRWYERAYDYWEDGDNCAPDDDGVLGGYGYISPTDISGSATFLDELKSMRPLLGDAKAAGGCCLCASSSTCRNFADVHLHQGPC